MKRKKPIVFFNASVILSGLHSPTGGSAKTLNWSKNRKIVGIASEIVVDEVSRKFPKLKLKQAKMKTALPKLFPYIIPPPAMNKVQSWLKIVADCGDAHILASAEEIKADYLVSLDKKHILSLKKRVRKFSIVSPEELIGILSKK